ncbi:hypothetical protein MBLNU457_5445t1 [Dothideomycetes sp. NU457]
MSSFALRTMMARRAFTAAPVRGFRTASVLNAGKESTLGQDGRAEEADRIKNEQVQKQREGKGHWHEEIASDSESIVKADRGEISADADTIKKLQDETAKLASQKK